MASPSHYSIDDDDDLLDNDLIDADDGSLTPILLW